MILIQHIRDNAAWVKERLAVKNFKDVHLVDEIVSLDEERRKTQQELDALLNTVNTNSKLIGGLMKDGKKEEAEEKKLEVSQLKGKEAELKALLAELEVKQYEAIILLPNIASNHVPLGKTPEDNVVVRSGGIIPILYSGAVPHWDLCKTYNLVDFELGTKITGAGFPVYLGLGAKLQRGLTQFFLDYNSAAGYMEVVPPFMVNVDSAFGTGQLPDKEGQMYHATEDNFFLIPTSEVPVTNIYRDVIIKEEDLPIKMTAYSPCFRREAGSYGKDVRGLNRLHQFEKVEIVQITKPEDSYNTLEQMVSHVEGLLNQLELPYRILKLCGGDMSFASALTYDFEVWSAAQQRWLEVSSVSNFETFQTNRLKTRYKGEGGKTQLCHSLNGSSLALPRILAALLENFQTEEGIKIPNGLIKYIGTQLIK